MQRHKSRRVSAGAHTPMVRTTLKCKQTKRHVCRCIDTHVQAPGTHTHTHTHMFVEICECAYFLQYIYIYVHTSLSVKSAIAA